MPQSVEKCKKTAITSRWNFSVKSKYQFCIICPSQARYYRITKQQAKTVDIKVSLKHAILTEWFCKYCSFELPRYLLHILFAAKTTTYSEAACQLKTDMIIHPFAFRVHTHGLGRVVSGWKVTADQTWTLLGKRDPQLPQMFEEIKDKSITLRYGDTLGKNSIDIFF